MPELRPWRRRTDRREPRDDIRWGLAGLAAVVLLVIAIGAVYVTGTTPEHTYRADLAQAGSIRTGDDVRVAGIPVGKVKSLTLLADRVRMEFTVDAETFVGDQSTLDVRMLTVVGGYYLSLSPAGTQALGDTVIPQQRVTLPYSLTRAFQDAVEPVAKIDGDMLRQDMAAVSQSISGSPDSVHAALNAAGTLVGILDKQNADISRTMSMTDEYLSALNANSDVLARLLNTFGTLEELIRHNKLVVSQALRDLAAVATDFTPLGRAWDAGLKDRARSLTDANPILTELGDRLGTLLDSLRGLEQKLLPLLPAGGGVQVDQSAATVPVAPVCVPVPVPEGGC
ncbi:MlaD family protein [Nocardia sp. NBC_01503]|uniref:MlaD family protein n=1 Tax=Nocardia sp. NBC_01503 TaxID=2975997 RepID=UPI002E7C54A1|nr:MlaD family protein [Nocardia sp. NBC_01503]WTL30163.1 MlaD family protein [Nocardia sp. NBC_01503]